MALEALYTAGIVAKTDQRPLDVINELAEAMGGRVAFVGNQLLMRSAAYVAPVLALGDDDFAGGAVSLQVRTPRENLFNVVTGTIIDAVQGWKPDVDFPRVAGEITRQLVHRGRQRRRKTQRLPLFRQHRQDTAQRRLEAHVEHPIGLVEDERFAPGQIDGPAIEVIDEAARRGDDDVDAGAQLTDLRAHRDAAEDSRHAHADRFRVGRERLVHLQRELARRHEHEDPRASRRAARVTDEQPIDQWKGERGGLARAGLRPSDEVMPFEHNRDGSGLHRRRHGIAGVSDGREHLRREAEACKSQRFLSGLFFG